MEYLENWSLLWHVHDGFCPVGVKTLKGCTVKREHLREWRTHGVLAPLKHIATSATIPHFKSSLSSRAFIWQWRGSVRAEAGFPRFLFTEKEKKNTKDTEAFAASLLEEICRTSERFYKRERFQTGSRIGLRQSGICVKYPNTGWYCWWPFLYSRCHSALFFLIWNGLQVCKAEPGHVFNRFSGMWWCVSENRRWNAQTVGIYMGTGGGVSPVLHLYLPVVYRNVSRLW